MISKVFKAYDVRATVPEPLNEDVAWRIGNATAQFLRTSLKGYDRSDSDINKIVVGRDMRTHSPSLCNAFIEGAVASGTDVIDIGMIDTSQIYFAVNHLKCCGGAQTTASHNPENYNGFKICGLGGKPIGAESGLKEIERIAQAISRHKVESLECVQHIDLTEPYRDYVRKFLETPRKLKIVVDASNGMAGRWFPRIFDGVQNLEIIPINYTHDGTFVHPPNPLVPENLAQLRAKIAETGADFGACFDGDADRCVFVDESGEIIACDLIGCLLAREFLRDNAAATVVFDLRSSRVLREEILAAGGVPKRQRVGHVYMKRAMKETNGIFGAELSGHFYFRDYWACDSGMLAFIWMVNVLTRSGQTLGELIRPLRRLHSSGERNFVNDDKDGTLKMLDEKYADGEVDHLDGVTVQYEHWWFNVRASNTEPLLRLNVEADSAELLKEQYEKLVPLLGTLDEGH